MQACFLNIVNFSKKLTENEFSDFSWL